MKIIPKGGKEKEPEITLEQLFDMIADRLKTLGRDVSPDRQHSVDSHLRAVIRKLGYIPREKKENPASIPELAAQCHQALKLLNGIAPEKQHDLIIHYSLTTLSNLEAEIREGLTQAHEVPKELPEPPVVPSTQP